MTVLDDRGFGFLVPVVLLHSRFTASRNCSFVKVESLHDIMDLKAFRWIVR